MWKRFAAALVLLLASAGAGAARDGVVRIGILSDMSGRFADLGGPGSVVAAQMAIEDFGGKVLGQPIELLRADHQNRADVGVAIARQWFASQGVDMINDLLNSAVALAVVDQARQADRIAIVNGAGTTRLTNEDCTPNSIHYAWDTYALSQSIARSVVSQGGDTWFFITADYAGGHSQEKEAADVVRAAGGRVLGRVTHPQDAPDFSSYILQAQASGAKVVALANGATDTVNAIKQAGTFGLAKSGQTLIPLAFFISDVHALGLETAQGVSLVEGFYWDRTADTRAFARRFYARAKQMPTMVQAGVYSSTLHYLKAVQDAGTAETAAVMAKMRALPVEDMFGHGGVIRADGRMVHDMYLFRVKAPAQSKEAWDYFDLVAAIPGAEVFQPLANTRCKFVRQ